jgi:hypothetical protein
MDNLQYTLGLIGFIFGTAALYKITKLEKELKDNNIISDQTTPSKGDK